MPKELPPAPNGKIVWLKGKTIKTLWDFVKSLTPHVGEGLDLEQMDTGWTIGLSSFGTSTGGTAIVNNVVLEWDNFGRITTLDVFQEYKHPWRVTPNGDNTVTITAGEVLSWENQASAGAGTRPSYYHLTTFASYAGGTATVSGTGKIYGKISTTSGGTEFYDDWPGGGIFYLDRVVPTGTLTVHYGTMPTTGDVFCFEIAQVSLSGGVAQVDKQVITHNPTLDAHEFIPPAP